MHVARPSSARLPQHRRVGITFANENKNFLLYKSVTVHTRIARIPSGSGHSTTERPLKRKRTELVTDARSNQPSDIDLTSPEAYQLARQGQLRDLPRIESLPTSLRNVASSSMSKLWKPKKEWFAGLSDEDKQRWLEKKLEQKPRKRKRGFRRSYPNKRFRAGPQPIIVSPGVGKAMGYGAYGVQGGIKGSILGQEYNVRGFYDSSKDENVAKGYGAYNVRSNSLMNMIDLGTGVPRIVNTKKGEAVIMSHCEYIGDLYSGSGTPTTFNLRSYSLNPGNGLLFPWGSKTAQQFEEYEIRGMLIELRTLSSDYAANLSMGSLFMAANYNASQPAPTTKLQLENYEYSSSSKPSQSLIMPIECDPRNNAGTHLRIADNEDYEGNDKMWYDWCNIFIGTQGIPTANTPIAEIWVSYEIALFKPYVSPQSLPGQDITSAHFVCSDIDSAHPLGSTQKTPESSELIKHIGNFIELPGRAGSWMITYAARTGPPEAGSPGQVGIAVNGNLAIRQAWCSDAATFATSVGWGVTNTEQCSSWIVTMSDPIGGAPPGGTVQFLTGANIGPGFADIFVTPIATDSIFI